MKKFLIALVVIAALGYGGVVAWQQWGIKKHTGRLSARATTAKAELRDIRLSLNAAGDIGPADQVSVRPEVNGKIAILAVDIGDNVKKGDLLFTLDDSDLQIERETKLSAIEAAKLQLEKSKRTWERSQSLVKDNLISREAFDDAKTDFEMAQNTLDRAQKDLNLVEWKLTKTKIVAPFDCTVLTRPVSVGQAVSGSGGFNSGTEVMTIANLNNMIIMAHINQADVTHLMPKQSVDIQVESVAGLTMKGVVERIAPQATIKNGLKGFDARIVISKIDPRVRPGMTANLSIPVISARDALAIPIAAIYTEPNPQTKEMERFVYVKKSDTTYERRLVQLGVADTSFAEVTDGLHSGEIVSLEEPPADAEIQSVAGGVVKKKKKSKSSSPGKAPPTKSSALLPVLQHG